MATKKKAWSIQTLQGKQTKFTDKEGIEHEGIEPTMYICVDGQAAFKKAFLGKDSDCEEIDQHLFNQFAVLNINGGMFYRLEYVNNKGFVEMALIQAAYPEDVTYIIGMLRHRGLLPKGFKARKCYRMDGVHERLLTSLTIGACEKDENGKPVLTGGKYSIKTDSDIATLKNIAEVPASCACIEFWQGETPIELMVSTVIPTEEEIQPIFISGNPSNVSDPVFEEMRANDIKEYRMAIETISEFALDYGVDMGIVLLEDNDHVGLVTATHERIKELIAPLSRNDEEEEDNGKSQD